MIREAIISERAYLRSKLVWTNRRPQAEALASMRSIEWESRLSPKGRSRAKLDEPEDFRNLSLNLRSKSKAKLSRSAASKRPSRICLAKQGPQDSTKSSRCRSRAEQMSMQVSRFEAIFHRICLQIHRKRGPNIDTCIDSCPFLDPGIRLRILAWTEGPTKSCEAAPRDHYHWE